MWEKLTHAEKRYKELEEKLADPAVLQDKATYQNLAKELSDLFPLVNNFRQLKQVTEEIVKLEHVLGEVHEPEFLDLARSELAQLTQKREELQRFLREELSPTEGKTIQEAIIEIRAGTGGQEASLFAADLYRMYTKYAQSKGWQTESMASHPTELGGFKEIIFSIRGKGAYSRLKMESGVHRVQRVPQTEASGRIHTSTITVAVLEEPKEIDLKIDPKDLKIDVFRSSGPGGQSVNTADSAVRITHLPTGMVVVCQDERSQLKNKNKAMRVLRARLMDQMSQEQETQVSDLRRRQIGTGERSEKIRTYNFPERRVTDHRIGMTLHKLDQVLEGQLEELFDALQEAATKDKAVS